MSAVAGDLTPCDFTPNALAGELISVRGSAIFTMHGAVLFSGSCANKGQHSAALMFPGERGTPLVAFELDPSAVARLRPFFRTSGGQAIASGVFSGEVFYKRGFHLKRSNGVTVGNGFGEHGTLRAAFVLQSVAEIRASN
jgi:hypothetical protein